MEELQPLTAKQYTSGFQYAYKSGEFRPLTIHACAKTIGYTNTGRGYTDTYDDSSSAAETQLSTQPSANAEHVEAAIV